MKRHQNRRIEIKMKHLNDFDYIETRHDKQLFICCARESMNSAIGQNNAKTRTLIEQRMSLALTCFRPKTSHKRYSTMMTRREQDHP